MVVATMDELNQLVDDEVSTAMKSGDTEAVNNIVSGTLSSLNSANCTLAPNCTALFRKECANTKDTCGACKDGYAGSGGGSDANTACFEVDTATTSQGGGRRRLYDLTEFTQNHRKLPAVAQKPCPSDCSDNGNCLYYGANDEALDGCLETTFKCRAQCSCNFGWTGVDCATPVSNITNVQAVKDNVCRSLYNLPLQDITADRIRERSGSVVSALIDPTHLTNQGFMNCTIFLLNTIEPIAGGHNYDDAAADSSSQSVFAAISSILNGDVYGKLPLDTLEKLLKVIKTLAMYREKAIVAGQSDSPFIDPNGNDNYRVVVGRERYQDLYGQAISTPMSTYEAVMLPSMNQTRAQASAA